MNNATIDNTNIKEVYHETKKVRTCQRWFLQFRNTYLLLFRFDPFCIDDIEAYCSHCNTTLKHFSKDNILCDENYSGDEFTDFHWTHLVLKKLLKHKSN